MQDDLPGERPCNARGVAVVPVRVDGRPAERVVEPLGCNLKVGRQVLGSIAGERDFELVLCCSTEAVAPLEQLAAAPGRQPSDGRGERAVLKHAPRGEAGC